MDEESAHIQHDMRIRSTEGGNHFFFFFFFFYFLLFSFYFYFFFYSVFSIIAFSIIIFLLVINTESFSPYLFAILYLFFLMDSIVIL
jgi:hypothetical protein